MLENTIYMFHRLLLIVFIFISFNANLLGQDDVKERISIGMCECINNLNKIKKVDFPDLKNCLMSSMQKNMALIYEKIKVEYGDSADYQKGFQYGEKIGRHVDTAMVYTCETYFRLVDSLRFAFVNQYNKDSASKLLIALNEHTTNSASDFLLERGRLNFLTGKYQSALNDIEKLEKDPQHQNTMLIIKGLCLDKIGRYQEAATVFYQLALISNQHTYLVSAAVENRKWQEQTK